MTHLESVNKKNPIDERILMALSEHYSFKQIINNKVPYLKDFVREGKTTLTWSIWNKWNTNDLHLNALKTLKE